jgi:hypothetical protein
MGHDEITKRELTRDRITRATRVAYETGQSASTESSAFLEAAVKRRVSCCERKESATFEGGLLRLPEEGWLAVA